MSVIGRPPDGQGDLSEQVEDIRVYLYSLYKKVLNEADNAASVAKQLYSSLTEENSELADLWARTLKAKTVEIEELKVKNISVPDELTEYIAIDSPIKVGSERAYELWCFNGGGIRCDYYRVVDSAGITETMYTYNGTSYSELKAAVKNLNQRLVDLGG